MIPVEQFPYGGAKGVVFAKDQRSRALPALMFPNGQVVIEWNLSEKERVAIARGENLRLWTWSLNKALQPITLEVTDEQQG